ncbi:MAG TPA: outer membrane beta-barrel protein [Chitinophagaceae bacterium]|nr:outer membrane beta-barrel protein [Chitinophagaceae bacterium]
MIKKITAIMLLAAAGTLHAQPHADAPFTVTIVTEKHTPAEKATVELLNAKDSSLAKTAITDTAGNAFFNTAATGRYLLRVSMAGYMPYNSTAFVLPLTAKLPAIILQPAANMLQNVRVTAKRPLIQYTHGKVVVNVDAAVTNTGASVMEVLEKSPGVTIDRNGNISLQSKNSVLVMIDDRPTYLSGTALQNLLSGMSASTVDQVELITSPPARYDASGNGGIINIKTKKNRQEGFNGTLTAAEGAGRYPKSNNSIILNYRKGKLNVFLNYNLSYNKGYTELYALRTYYNNDGSVASLLDQPTYFTGNTFTNNIKAGADYFISPKTTLGISLTGIATKRRLSGNAVATWLDAAHNKDSAISTTSVSDYKIHNGAANINIRHTISESQEFSVDLDAVSYKIDNQQYFSSKLLASSGYTDASDGNLPTTLHIFSFKADHTYHWGKTGKVESGIKTSRTSTDNIAAYQTFDGSQWMPDYSRSNHFIYKENIYAAYTSVEKKLDKFSFQAGLRYEGTHYDANQLGNVQVKDSSFSRNYSGLFPSGYISYNADSNNIFTFTAGRRIDRPAFQSLNPFVYIINKYTIQRGNPYFRPQYSWNLELSHQFKQLVTTTLSYAIVTDYFSQLFLTDPNGILVYSEGNVGRMYNLGLSVSVQTGITKWWSFTGEALLNHKQLRGYVWNNFSSSVTQLNLNINNQFHIGRSVTAELSGFYTTRARNDLQEILYPTGQLSAGAAVPVLNKKGTLKLSIRDILHTNVMEGLTTFQSATEYFIEHRDSRIAVLSFSWRFGKTLKQVKHSAGGATEEMERANG